MSDPRLESFRDRLSSDWSTPRLSHYTAEWYGRKRQRKVRSAQVVVPILIELAHPASVVDIGCGDGTWLSVFREHGVGDTFGIDGHWVAHESLQIPAESFLRADLEQSFSVDRSFDLAVSLEVAEHLPEKRARSFVEQLTALAPLVLFSAAVPFQDGTGHVNLQWQDHWARLFAERDYLASDAIRRSIWGNADVLWFYRQNAVLYVRRDAIAELPGIDASMIVSDLTRLRVVDPELYLDKAGKVEKLRYRQPGGLEKMRDRLAAVIGASVRRSKGPGS